MARGIKSGEAVNPDNEMPSEADIHFEFYRHLQNEIDAEPQRNGITFGKAQPEYGEDTDGFADIVLLDDDDDPVVVIEAKSPDTSRSRAETDPYSPKVIRQAFRYAGDIGASYIATFNGDRLVVFESFDPGTPLLQRSTKSYVISDLAAFSGTFLDEIARIHRGDPDWDTTDDAFIERLKSLHEHIAPELAESLTDHLDADGAFYDDFEQWTSSQGIEYDEADASDRETVREEFAQQAAYLLINKIVFYAILEDSPAYRDDIRPLEARSFALRSDLESCFDHIVEEIDFEAIFEHDPIYSEIPLEPVADRIIDFIEQLDEQNLQQFNSDVVGQIYEGVIPADRRHEMGEYYTPPEICDLICRLTIDDADDVVMDPGCGSGGFLVSAYHRKRDLLNGDSDVHDRIIDSLYGIDINRFPAHLSAINLAIQDLSEYTEQVHVEVSDFFHVNPDTQRFQRERATGEGSEVETGRVEALSGLDVVVGNPPYIRQELIDDKDLVRDHLSRVNGEHLSKRSDIYAYFLTHSTEFLRDGGRLGFITSDNWLDTSYGADLQEFLLDKYRIRAVIKFDRQAFTDALIGSTVIILQREQSASDRDENVTKFLRIHEELGINDIVEIVEEEHEPGVLVRDEHYRLFTSQQAALHDEEKWTRFFYAPALYFECEAADHVTRLDDIAELEYGIKSGANKFFINRREEAEELGILSYCRPLLKASGQVTHISFDGYQAEEWVILDVHDLVEEARDAMRDELHDNQATAVKEWFRENGHEDLATYIDWGEMQEYHTNTTCEKRPIWYDLGDMNVAPMLIPRFMWRRNIVLWNVENGVGTTQFYDIFPDEDVDARVVCALLNSRLAWLSREIEGRQAGGQGMTRNEVKVYEAGEILLPDPRELSDDERTRLLEAFDALADAQRASIEDDDVDVEGVAATEDLDALDEVVLDVIGMPERLDELKNAVEVMLRLREQAAGEETEVLVDRPEETEVIELEGVKASRDTTTLTDF